MKKTVTILSLFAAIISCSSEQSKYGQGGENACQYVREQVPEQAENIKSVEVIDEDSLLSDIGLTFADVQIAKAEGEFYHDNITRARLDEIIDSVSKAITDVQYSWQFSAVINDSLRRLPKYKHQWRKVYKVQVTMKSGDTKTPRVLMDEDGITPRCLEKEFESMLQEHIDNLMSTAKRITYGF